MTLIIIPVSVVLGLLGGVEGVVRSEEPSVGMRTRPFPTEADEADGGYVLEGARVALSYRGCCG